jgi:hypothetical protein
MASGIINRSYYDAAEKGRVDRDQAVARTAHNALSQQAVAQGERVNALMQDPGATPESYARVGRSDVANSLTNITNSAETTKAEGHKRLFLAAQYALQSPDPKAFIAQNFPELAQANPTFATDTPEQVAASLQQLLGMHGAEAGIAPQTPRGQGAMYKVVDPETGEVTYASAEEAQGKNPYIYKPPTRANNGPAPPRGYRYKDDGSVEPIPGGPNDPNSPNRPTMAPKPPTEGDKRALVMYRSMKNAEKQLEAVTTSDTSDLGQAILGKAAAGKVLQSQEYKRYEAAGLRWAANLLYLKSGATATPDEIRSTYLQFLPQPGDGQQVKDQKNEARIQEMTAVNEAYSFEKPATPASGAVEPTATDAKGNKIVFRDGQWQPL